METTNPKTQINGHLGLHLGILAVAVFGVGLSLYNFIKDRHKD